MNEPDVPDDLPLVSVAITARNAARTIERQLLAILGQASSLPCEIVVNVQPSRDETLRVCRDIADAHDVIKVIEDRAIGVASGRNHGILHCLAKTILTCDADDEVAADWLKVMYASLQYHDAVVGRLLPATAERTFTGSDSSNLGTQPYRYLPYGMTANLGFHRHVFDSLGGFDERLRAEEDVDFIWRLQERGYRLGTSEACVLKHTRPGARERFRQHYRYGTQDVLLYVLHREFGMPRTNWTEVASAWMWIFIRIPYALLRSRRRILAAPLGRRLGRLSASVERLTVYL